MHLRSTKRVLIPQETSSSEKLWGHQYQLCLLAIHASSRSFKFIRYTKVLAKSVLWVTAMLRYIIYISLFQIFKACFIWIHPIQFTDASTIKLMWFVLTVICILSFNYVFLFEGMINKSHTLLLILSFDYMFVFECMINRVIHCCWYLMGVCIILSYSLPVLISVLLKVWWR